MMPESTDTCHQLRRTTQWLCPHKRWIDRLAQVYSRKICKIYERHLLIVHAKPSLERLVKLSLCPGRGACACEACTSASSPIVAGHCMVTNYKFLGRLEACKQSLYSCAWSFRRSSFLAGSLARKNLKGELSVWPSTVLPPALPHPPLTPPPPPLHRSPSLFLLDPQQIKGRGAGATRWG
jgi:hypothetical protein